MQSTTFSTLSRSWASAALVFTVLGLSQCGISEQVQQAKAFKGAQIRLASVEQATVAGVDVTHLRQPGDLTTLDKARIAAAYATGSLPLRMRVNLEVRNPNAETAALNAFDYIALLDDKQVATGRSTERIEVAPNGVATAPVTLESNLRDALGEQSGEALASMVLGLGDHDRQPMRLTLRLKPTFVTSSGRTISPGGYITVNKEFTAFDVLDAVDRRDSLKQRP
ncbi:MULTISPECIES: LEA type 2 family protein [Hymenobacter]|uniref:Late embryogenesis abundant protein n=1 Tax=Hymenobacter mucosus TaxID=1411120 RepID=A0A239AIT6_9BACT|nr:MULTISPECIES: LEA type 2 family protein [Hymenobacter]SNR95460.1 Late embryogenesis abundant protein [Hymenobacter mucosus]